MSLILKYSGTQGDVGLALTATVIDKSGSVVTSGIALTEVGTTGLFLSNDLTATGEVYQDGLDAGEYLIRIIGPSSEQRGTGTFAWNGLEEIDNSFINRRLWTEREKRQIRDFGGVDGDKTVARDGQLQKKSEGPYNSTVDSEEVHPNDSNEPQ